MQEYHKIQTVFKRDPANRHKTLLEGEFSLPEFEFLKDNKWIFTEKVDGTNIRIMFNGDVINFGGRTDRAQLPADLVARLQEKFLVQPDRFREEFPDGGCLYGEGYGAGIQKGGGNYSDHKDFVLFDVRVGDWWLSRSDVIDVAQKFGVPFVPILAEGTLSEMVEAARSGITSSWGCFQAEGIVARPSTELQTRGGKRIITKIKCKDFDHVV